MIRYAMTDQITGETVLTGKVMHCFTDSTRKPVIPKKRFPEMDSLLRKGVSKDGISTNR